MKEYINREIAAILSESLKNMPVVVLSGMRQSGKSTFLKNQPELRDRIYYNFDDFSTLESARRNPEKFISNEKEITIDEVQKFPEILTIIKQEVDKKRVPGKFLLSGSANLLLLKNVSESLAGRAVYLTLHPFSHREQLHSYKSTPIIKSFFITNNIPDKDIKQIEFKDVILGGMPTVCLKEVSNPSIWFRGYEQTYLERDIRELSQIPDLISFRQLMQLIALRNSNILNQSQLARNAKLNVTTTGRYISLMETSFVLTRLLPYLGNRSSRLIKSPKIFISDTGLAFHLSGLDKDSLNEPLLGSLWESYVAQNLHSILSAHLPDSKLFYWNIQGRHEVDFIVESGNKTIAIEIKSGSRWQEKDLNGLKAFLASAKNCIAGFLAYNGNKTVQLSDDIWALPISLLIS